MKMYELFIKYWFHLHELLNSVDFLLILDNLFISRLNMDGILTALLKKNNKVIVDDHDRLFVYIHTFIIYQFPQTNVIKNISI
jgi:hypothetical protein